MQLVLFSFEQILPTYLSTFRAFERLQMNTYNNFKIVRHVIEAKDIKRRSRFHGIKKVL